MSTSFWWIFGGVALALFWAVGAYNRLSGLRDRVVQRQADADRMLRARHQAVLAWVASSLQGGATDAARPGAPDEALPGLHPTLPPAPDDGTVQRVRHACAQAAAAGDAVRARPTRRGAMASLNMAEQVLESALQSFMQEPAAAHTPAARLARSAWMACEVELTVARQVLNADIGAYNAGVRQFPARLLAALFGMGATEALRAGAELSPLIAAPGDAPTAAPTSASTEADAGARAGAAPAAAPAPGALVP